MPSLNVPDASLLSGWRKSSHSGGDNGDCLEVTAPIPTAAFLVWRKSSYSAGDGGDCLEVADGVTGVVPVRDSKDTHGPALVFPAERWARFVAAVRGGAFDG